MAENQKASGPRTRNSAELGEPEPRRGAPGGLEPGIATSRSEKGKVQGSVFTQLPFV